MREVAVKGQVFAEKGNSSKIQLNNLCNITKANGKSVLIHYPIPV